MSDSRVCPPNGSANQPTTGSPLLYAFHMTGRHPEESNWQDLRRYNATQLPTSTRQWLLDQGSLTQRLIKRSAGQFAVHLMSQAWQRPRHSEARLLGMAHREQAIVREVVLKCFDQPWVFARSVIPASSLNGHLRQLRQLKTQPLGAMLFKDPGMHRQPFQLACISGDDPQIPAQLHQSMQLWGRRCRFELSDKPIMVSEIFLPNFKP